MFGLTVSLVPSGLQCRPMNLQRALLASRRGLGRTPSTPGLSSTPSMGSRPGSTIDLTRLPSISEQAQGSGSEASFSAPPAQEGTPGISSDAPMPSSQNNSEVTTGDGACGDASQPTGSQGAEAAQPAGVPAELQGGDQTEGGDEVIDPTLLPGGTLVVCPTSVLHQWKKEIEAKVNMGFLNFTVHVYHGKVQGEWVGVVGVVHGGVGGAMGATGSRHCVVVGWGAVLCCAVLRHAVGSSWLR